MDPRKIQNGNLLKNQRAVWIYILLLIIPFSYFQYFNKFFV